MALLTEKSFHDRQQLVKANAYTARTVDVGFRYTFENFFHPFVGELIGKLNTGTLADMLNAKWQESLKRDFFEALYNPNHSLLSDVTSFPKTIDVTENGAYSNYNWELFFHIPITVAVHLSKAQRFAEAQRWFHYVFDPTSSETGATPAQRLWKFLAFRQADNPKQIDELLRLLSRPLSELTAAEKKLREDVLSGYDAILAKPFRPHAVARTRHIAYQYSVVMKYLDNLIAWGDNLFQQDTIESINEATQRYVLAANLLGPRPQQVPSRGRVRPKTFAQLDALLHDPMGNALVELEGQFPFNLGAPPGGGAGAGSAPLFGIGRTLYFCVPRNDKLLSYWDSVADRLFKIRHCMNIEGVVRPLALFDPPIDPGMLVKAVAAGLDIGGIVSGLTQPVGPIRALTLVQKSLELCSEVRSLGSALLSAIEKGDAEHLALVRQRHEATVQAMTRDVRFLQWKSAEEATKSLLTARGTALERLRYYQRVLGLPLDPMAPDTLALRRGPLTEENFDEAYASLVGEYDRPLSLQALPAFKAAGATSPAQQSGAEGAGRVHLNVNEGMDLNVLGPLAHDDRVAAMASDVISGVLSLIPDMGVDLHFWGLGGNAKLFGGTLLAGAGRFASSVKNVSASVNEAKGSTSSKTGTYERRADDWVLQYNLAAHEVMQNGRQILSSLIAEQLAKHEYDSHLTQMENTQEIDRLLHGKFSNEELHLWMQGELSRLYYEYYRFAFDTARKAERTMKHELMRPEVDAQDFVKFNYWDGGRKGLLAGEALHLDVKRMELAYLDQNRREFELTRHVSLRQLDPLALLTLRATGTCQLAVPEWLYDRDCPGHYMRRVKSVAVSVPSVVGPYTNVHCTLSLLRSSVRKSPLPKDGEYARQGAEDDRFVDYAGAVQSIVTSAASNDSGLFETNLRDDRFLPFEGAGAVSQWKLALPTDYRAFDYTTIADVVLHIRYTARAGVNPTLVIASVDEALQAAAPSQLALLFSLRNDFPNAWSAFANGAATFDASISRDWFPYLVNGKAITIVGLDLYAHDPNRHHTVGNVGTATSDLGNNGAFTLSLPPDAAGPTQILTRVSTAQAYLVVRYTI